jgi:uncharacterized membrane protein YoaK (UPF0700 family)
MEEHKHIGSTTLILASVAGYCDTVTFVSGDNIFSAHVTGNFIVFAYQIIGGSDLHSWVKLLTFPVFIISAMFGGWLMSKLAEPRKILLLEGILLLVTGLTTIVIDLNFDAPLAIYPIVMSIIFAMGLQNAFGKLYAKETFGPTNMMTGNVTQASLDLGTEITSGFKNILAFEGLKHGAVTIGGFLAGCLLGALFAKFSGLCCITFPGLAIIACYLFSSGHQF